MPTSPLALVLMSHDIQALIGVEAHRVLMVEYGVAVTGDLELDEAIAVTGAVSRRRRERENAHAASATAADRGERRVRQS
jgi:hypothetical protein